MPKRADGAPPMDTEISHQLRHQIVASWELKRIVALVEAIADYRLHLSQCDAAFEDETERMLLERLASRAGSLAGEIDLFLAHCRDEEAKAIRGDIFVGGEPIESLEHKYNDLDAKLKPRDWRWTSFVGMLRRAVRGPRAA